MTRDASETPKTLSRINRRDFTKGGLALGAAALAAPLPGPAHSAAPRRGGRLRVGMSLGSTTDSLDPAAATDTYMIVLNAACRSNLAEISSTGEIVPELAQSWEPSSDARTWVVTLRKGVEFHSGKSLDAPDVIATFNHHRGPDSKSAAKSLVDQIVDIKPDGSQRVVFTLAGGNADFPAILSDPLLPICPALPDGKLDWMSGAGTGGYSILSFAPGVAAELKRNPNYWKPERAHFDEAVVSVIHDVAARTEALKTGQIDVMDRCDLKTLDLLERIPTIAIKEAAGMAHYTMPMFTGAAPFDSNDVRLALRHGIDRTQLLNMILHGRGTIGNDHPISVFHKFHNKDLEQRGYDPDKARFHLKKAGLSTLRIALSTADAAFAGAVDAAVLCKESAAKAGIDIEVKREANDAYWSNVWMKAPWCMSFWSGRVTEDLMFSIAYAADSNWNESYWKHERFNRLLLEARPELDQSRRKELYGEMQKILWDEGGSVVPLFNNHVFAASSRLDHAEPGGDFTLDGGRLIERWWFS